MVSRDTFYKTIAASFVIAFIGFFTLFNTITPKRMTVQTASGEAVPDTQKMMLYSLLLAVGVSGVMFFAMNMFLPNYEKTTDAIHGSVMAISAASIAYVAVNILDPTEDAMSIAMSTGVLVGIIDFIGYKNAMKKVDRCVGNKNIIDIGVELANIESNTENVLKDIKSQLVDITEQQESYQKNLDFINKNAKSLVAKVGLRK